jgi:hypothetical protein
VFNDPTLLVVKGESLIFVAILKNSFNLGVDAHQIFFGDIACCYTNIININGKSGIFHVCHTLDTKREFAISTNSLFDYALLGSAVTELRIGYADDVYPSVVDAYYQYMDDPSLPFFDYKSGASGPISEFTDYG